MGRADLASYAMIERLVGFDTTSRNSNLALIEWAKDYLEGHGAECRLTYDDERRKANLFATLGPKDRPGLVLSGHTDVVPVDGQAWDTEPFAVAERDGRLHGRGAADMKSYLAVVLTMVPELVRRGLTTPLHIAMSYDEEVGCAGAPRMLADLKTLPVRPFACIIGEPTLMTPVNGHKGKMSVRARVRGLECHSALAPQGVNAVEFAAEAVSYLKGMARRQRRDGPFNPLFDPPYTTVHTGTIQGGTALNIVPKDCCFEFEFRHLPGVDAHQLLDELQGYVRGQLEPEMRAVSAEAGFGFEGMSTFPGLETPEEADVTVLVKQLTGANAVGKVAFGTEAGLFQDAGIPTIVCGPGSIEQAHKPNEWIAIEQIAQCERFVGRLVDRLCAG